MSDLSYLLDGEGLARVALGDPGMKALLKDAHRSGIRVATSAMNLAEACHSKIRQPAWDWAVSGVGVEPVTRSVAEEAMSLLRSTGLHGDQYAIAAVLAVIAGRQRGRAVVFTSDADGMGKLCGTGARVRAL
ncbi:hypothetical protein AMK09_02000 [Streptomyces sp. CB02488]|uniref:hypothetical protein n=1 Tax=Streptomyces sp. CB02488 TaxID=1703920 RepID=UPI00093FE33F|nr:hypothetical protein [Streptomyces sp. CB02488]OKK24984.1 hypothetical protein AMK09_02000 [Streptomyces sp. CB02488]